MNWDKTDKEILHFVQGDIPVTSNPFADLAASLDLTEEDIVKRIKTWQEKGIVRRFGAVLRHQKAGYNTNAMVAWLVDEEDADKIGKMMAEHPKISHCYLREVPQEFGYNLFTMIHAQNQQQLDEIVEHISQTTNLKNYKILQSLKELKKVSMKYV